MKTIKIVEKKIKKEIGKNIGRSKSLDSGIKYRKENLVPDVGSENELLNREKKLAPNLCLENKLLWEKVAEVSKQDEQKGKKITSLREEKKRLIEKKGPFCEFCCNHHPERECCEKYFLALEKKEEELKQNIIKIGNEVSKSRKEMSKMKISEVNLRWEVCSLKGENKALEKRRDFLLTEIKHRDFVGGRTFVLGGVCVGVVMTITCFFVFDLIFNLIFGRF